MVSFDCCINFEKFAYSLVLCVCFRMPKGRKPSERDRDPQVFPFYISCCICGVREHLFGNYVRHIYKNRCRGYPAGCGHCGGVFSSALDLSRHLNVGGLTRSLSAPLYIAVTRATFISVNSVFPTAVNLCPSNISLIPSAIPAHSILQFSSNSTSNSTSLNSGTDHSATTTCQNTDVPSLSTSAQSSSPSSLSSCLSPNFLLARYSPNPSFQLSPSSFLCSSPISSSPVTSAAETSVSISTPPICSVSPSQSSPITSVRQHDGARLVAGDPFPFRPDRSEDYLYLFFLYHVVNSSYCTSELQQRFDSMETSFRSYLVAHNYSQALEVSVGDLLLTHFAHLNSLVGERDRHLPSS